MVWKHRLCGEKLYHHIYAWGNDRHPVFKEREHYREYIRLLKKNLEDYKVDIVAYALMEWHVHLFVFDEKNNISNFMLKLHGDYAQYFNRVTNRVGHVFGERFKNKIVKPNQYGLWLSRYIHLQPVEAGIVKDPKEYPWTSYKAYAGIDKMSFVKPDIILRQFGNKKDKHIRYEEFVLNTTTASFLDQSTEALRNADAKYMLDIVCRELKVDQSTLLHPKNMEERKKKNDAINLLYYEYGYQKTQIATAFGLSRAAVTLNMKRIK